jgi:hypothetical protein
MVLNLLTTSAIVMNSVIGPPFGLVKSHSPEKQKKGLSYVVTSESVFVGIQKDLSLGWVEINIRKMEWSGP